MQPYCGRIALAVLISVPLLGCHGPDRVGSAPGDGGGLVNVRTRNGVHVRAPFVNVHVATRNSEGHDEAGPAPLPPAEMAPPD